MKDEGYNKKEIQEAINKGKENLNNLMLKSVRRMQHFNQDLFVKPKAFDRWRMFVYYRKAFRYWLNWTNSRGEYCKGDLAMAFNKWKNLETKHKEVLSKMCKKDLEKKVN